MSKVLSLIIPSYNMERYLDKCLSSLIIPSIESLDVIIVNDGSKDSTSEIAHGYSKRFPTVFHVIDKTNGNYGSCINVGIKEAKGKYIKVLDADDYFNPDDLEKYLQKISDIDVDLIITNYNIVNEDGQVTKKWNFSEVKPNSIYDIANIESNICDELFQMHAVTYRTENIRALNYRQIEGISYTDQQWMFLPMSMVQKVFYNDVFLYQYLVGREGQTVSSDAYVRNFRALQIISKQMIDDYHKIVINNSYFKYRIRRQLETLYYILLIRKKEEESNSALIEIDNQVKEQIPDLFEELNNIKLFGSPLKYIRYWRFNNRVNGLKLFKLVNKFIEIRKAFR